MTILQIRAIHKLITREKPGWKLISGEDVTMSPERGKRLLRIKETKGNQETTIVIDLEKMAFTDFLNF